ncbi:MAG TPA: ATP-binding protein, partial [Candidatus Dormibacteraeota bacterium]|nr:ATP-binding protein [Candidatus Dormibacteraeota bacterium]
AQDMPRLFTRFGRIVTADNARIPGTGLGLYLAQRFANMHGGRITVDSQPGKGSSFELRIPIAAQSNLPRALVTST